MSAPLGTFENPRPYDILCGRNRNSFNNIGNRRFRITISMNIEKYDALHSRHERSKFISSLAQTLRYEVGFRFLKRTPGGGSKKKKKSSQTTELTDDEIRAKVGHALRDLSTAMQQQNGEDKNTPESKVPRSGPYKTQDKTFQQSQHQPLTRVVSCCSTVETTESAQTTLDGTLEEDKKPSQIPSSHLSSDPITTIQEPETLDLSQTIMPDASAVPSSVSPPPSNDIMSSLKETIKAIEQDSDLQVFPLDIGEACESLLPAHLIPSVDHDHDEEYFEMINDFSWRTPDELRSTRSTNMSISASSCDMMSVQSSFSDVMETLSVVSA